MKILKLGTPGVWLYRLAARLSGHPNRRMQIIGGSDGPTAIFVTSRRRARGKRQNGLLLMQADWSELALAFQAAAIALASWLAVVAAIALFRRNR